VEEVLPVRGGTVAHSNLGFWSRMGPDAIGCHRRARGAARMALVGALAGSRKWRKGGVTRSYSVGGRGGARGCLTQDTLHGAPAMCTRALPAVGL
jgi:hypothetical protein